MSGHSWKIAYQSMTKAVATWGAEIGWKGQEVWAEAVNKLQYQALRKATGAVVGASMEMVRGICGATAADAELDSQTS